MDRILEFIRYPSHGRTWALLGFLILVLAIPLTVNIAQKQQELRQRAAFDAGGGGGGKTQCEGNGGYCDNGVCAKFVPKCLYPDIVSQNNYPCINPSENCIPAGGQDPARPQAKTYQCSDLQPQWSCAPSGPAAPTCQYSCLWGSIQNCESSEGAGNCTVIPGQTCSNGRSCIKVSSGTTTPSPVVNNCTGSCLWGSIQQCEQAEGFGKCSVIPGQSCGDAKACIKVADGASASCDPNNINDGWTYQCGVAAGCAVGEHKSICTRNPSQDTRCFSDSLFPAGDNRCAGTGGTPATSQPTSACKQPPTTDFVNICPAPLKANPQQDIAVCNAPNAQTRGDVPVCPSNLLVKKQNDGSLYCFDSNTNTFVSYATCGAPQPECTVVNNSLSTACKAAANTCALSGAKGKRDIVKDSGTTGCRPVTLKAQDCDLTANDNNCTSTNVCPASGSGACVLPVTGNLAGNIQLTFNLKLDGLGSTGDVKNPGSQRNNPAKKARNVSAVLVANGVSKTASGNLNVNDLSATVTTNAGNLVNGTYELFVKVDGFLQRKQGTFNLEAGKNNPIGLLPNSLPNGNVNRDKTVDAADYGKLKDCFTAKSTSGDCANADLDDDQQITLFDLNLLLREFGLNDE